MSLYVGNLSEHTRRDELERVFRRFGHCNVQMKREGYGFVVYDFPPDADKALRALQGRNICGEPLTLTWSKKQPRHFQRFARGDRTFELQRVRTSVRIGYERGKFNLNGWRNYMMGSDGRGKSADLHSGERGYQDEFKDYVGEDTDYRGDFPDEGDGVIPNLEDNGRWGEAIHDPSINNGNENAVEFDHYEPYHGYDRKHENDYYQTGYSGGSPAGNFQEDMRRSQIGEAVSNHPNDSKYQQSCFRCGDSGHKMRNCPKAIASQRKYSRLDGGHDDKIDKEHKVEDDLNKFGSSSRVKMQSSGDTLSTKYQRNERKVSDSQHYWLPLKNEFSLGAKETDQSQQKEYRGKKQSRKEIKEPKRSNAKKARRSNSSSLHSNYTVSCSHSMSQSSKSLPRSRSHSRSRSESSRALSPYSNLKSSSKSHYSTGRSPNSRRFSSLRSISVSLDNPSSSPPNKVELNSTGTSINATAPQSSSHLVAQGQQIDSNVEIDKDTTITVSENEALCTSVLDDKEMDLYAQEDKNETNNLFNPSDEVMDLTKPVPDEGTFTAGNLSPEVVRETEGFRHSGILTMDDDQTKNKNPAPDTHVNLYSGQSAITSLEEMCTVLKHYGLELSKEDEQNLTVDGFFGSARLWPWHIIYYRRLKKGPISTENYARRVAQNQEFGIIDNYVRSSSGWGEFCPENS